MNAVSPEENSEKEISGHHYGLRTVMELFDIGPTVAITVLSITFVIFVLGIIIFIRSAPPSQLTITSGPEGSSFYKTAKRYAKVLEKSGVKVNILTSNGSLQNLERLSDPKSKVELGLVQGGISDKNDHIDSLISLGSISHQPLMVFYRGKPIELLSQLEGRTIAVGHDGSGTRRVALKLLSLNGIKESDPKSTKLLDMDADDATDALFAKKIDAAFIMSENASNEDMKKLLRAPDIHLFSFKQAAAYSRKVDYLDVLEMPEGSIDLGLNLPNKDVSLLGPMIELVAIKDLHPALSDLILEAASEIHNHPGLYQKRGEFPMAIEHDIKLSDDANRYYKSGKTFIYRYFPYWLASLISRILVVFLPMAVLLIPALRSVPAFFRWRTQMRLRRRYRELLALEGHFRNESDPTRLTAIRKQFERIDNETSRMPVRPAYADQFYSLRGHIDYVRGLMAKRMA